MNTKMLCSTNQGLDELEEAAIVSSLQSSDADSSSEEDVTPNPSKTGLQPLPSDVPMWKAVINIVNYIEGIGFLALPYTLKKGGIAAIIAFIIIPIILWYTGKILIECLYDEKGARKIRARSTIKDLGDVLSPKYGGYIISGCIQLDVFLLSVSYLTLCGSLMHHALPSVPITELEWTCITGAIVLPTTFLKSLSRIAWLSTISVFALVMTAVAVVWYGAGHSHEWDLGTILFWDTEGVFIALGIILYSYASMPILPHVEESMADRAKFSTALGLAHLVNTLMKLLLSLFGFLSFGNNTNEAIINNLPPGPIHITVSSVFALSCILSYVLALYPVLDSADSLTSHIQSDKIPSFFMYAVVRVTLVVLAVVVAVLVPHFALIVSFLGSFNAPFVLYVFPCAVHLKLKNKQLKTCQIYSDLCLVVFGLIVTVFGTTISIKTLIQAL